MWYALLASRQLVKSWHQQEETTELSGKLILECFTTCKRTSASPAPCQTQQNHWDLAVSKSCTHNVRKYSRRCFGGHRAGHQRVLLDSLAGFTSYLGWNIAQWKYHHVMKFTVSCKFYKRVCLIPLSTVQILINGGFKAAKCSAEIVKKTYRYLTSWHVCSALQTRPSQSGKT